MFIISERLEKKITVSDKHARLYVNYIGMFFFFLQ